MSFHEQSMTCPDAVVATRALERYHAVRRESVRLAEPLSEEDCCAQSMPDASPVKWHLAHTTWFFETFLLEKYETGFTPFHPAFRMLFNSYYDGIGDRHARPLRGLLTRPSLDEVLAYRHQVDRRVALLLGAGIAADVLQLLELGLHHEQQHQELMLTDVLHLLWMNPLKPAYKSAEPDSAPNSEPMRAAEPLQWIAYPGGLAHVGHDPQRDGDFCFDNELPRHREFMESFLLGDRLVTQQEYRAFVEDDGYARPELWMAEGWDWIRNAHIAHPLYWEPSSQAERWDVYGFHGLRPMAPHAPLTQISWFEADAYARWSGARLPTEAEWEYAASAGGLRDSAGVAWQWTSSSYGPYPGYAPAAGAIGEYNGKFMSNQYVLRGGSAVTPAGHARASYRNFFPATTRWQMTGIRLARAA